MSLKHKTTVAFTISIYQEIESTKKSLNDLKNYIQLGNIPWVKVRLELEKIE